MSVWINLRLQVSNRRERVFRPGAFAGAMPGDGVRWALVDARRKLEAAQVELARLKDRVKELEGQVIDLGGDPNS